MKTIAFISITFLFVALVTVVVLFLTLKYVRLLLRYNRISKYLYNYLNLIIGARYGNLVNRCDDGIDPLTIQLSRNTNAFLESVVDRDAMINEYIEREKQSQNIKQDFISGLAHDLKVPIIAQDNTYDLFLAGNFGEISKVQENAIKNLKLSNNDLKNLIIDMLDVYKLDKQEIKLDLKNVHLNQLIKDIIEQNQNIAKIQEKNLIFESNCDMVFHNVDSFLIKRVLNNLIANAFSHTKKDDIVKVFLEENPHYIRISVIDSGIGIKENEINKIFKKYYTSSKKYSNIGSGLGLYIANKIILAHNGKISAKNNQDKGACFSIILPTLH